MLEIILAILIVIFAAYIIYINFRISDIAKKRAEKIFGEMREELENNFEAEYENKLEKWKMEFEKFYRKDALERARAVLKGKIGEQLAPILEVFGHSPADARFIGSPVDYIIFDGYSEGEIRKVVLADVKTGEAKLTKIQKEIRGAIEKGKVKWETINLR